jgi:HEAT repeat protein
MRGVEDGRSLAAGESCVRRALRLHLADVVQEAKADAGALPLLPEVSSDPSVAASLSRLLANTAEDASVREASTLALGKLRRSASTLHVLLQNASDKSSRVRSAVASSLGKYRGDDCLMALLKLASDNEAAVRSAAVTSLINFRSNAEALAAIYKALDDSDKTVRLSATEVLIEAFPITGIPRYEGEQARCRPTSARWC